MRELRANVAIIGAGVIGATIARELSRYKLNTILIDKQADVGWGTTKANTGIVHAGYSEDPHTLRGKLCAPGNHIYQQLCEELEVPFKRIGSIVVSFNEDELTALHKLENYSKICGVPGTRILKKDELHSMVPHLTPKAVYGFYAPTAAVVSPYGLTIALVENAKVNGVNVLLKTKVLGLRKNRQGIILNTSSGDIHTNFVINAAGLWADEISAMSGEREFNIHPRKGVYVIFDDAIGEITNKIIFPVPTPISKGIAFVPFVEGNYATGPTAEDIQDKENLSTSSKGLKKVFNSAEKFFQEIPFKRYMTRNFCGLRAVADEGDFIIRPSYNIKGLIHAAGIQSPGLAAAPAIASMVIDILKDQGLKLHPNPHFNPERRAIQKIKDVDNKIKEKLIKRDPRYGHIVCRCETVSEAEVIEAIKRGATTLDGVKFRTRCGMGRCQGGFCTPRIIEILSRELHIPSEEISKRNKKSWLIKDKALGANA
jgi:glycerol-3-phosphate dehydrogenase